MSDRDYIATIPAKDKASSTVEVSVKENQDIIARMLRVTCGDSADAAMRMCARKGLEFLEKSQEILYSNRSRISYLSEDARKTRQITRAQFDQYFYRMRIMGGRNSSTELQEEFWQYLIEMDFLKADGAVIDKSNINSTFVAWRRRREREAAEAINRANAKALEAAKNEAETNKINHVLLMESPED